MNDFVLPTIRHALGNLTLNRPHALNALSLDMVRTITERLLAWRDDADIQAVCLDSSSDKAFCAGGDIRFFYRAARQFDPPGGRALMEDFFTEEYALNRLIHHYPKTYIAVMDGIVMGGGMGIAQCRSAGRLRIVTERTRIAMPEVNIGLFPDVGASFFLSRTPGKIGVFLGLTGTTIGALDALHAGLADLFVPSAQLPALRERLTFHRGADIAADIRNFAAPFAAQAVPKQSLLAREQPAIDRHFSAGTVADIMASLAQDPAPFAQSALAAMRTRSPRMLCVTLEQLRRASEMTIEACLQMERSMMRHCFAGAEAIEGIRAAVIDKDRSPRWQPAALADVTPEMVADFFAPAWPDYLHPLRNWL